MPDRARRAGTRRRGRRAPPVGVALLLLVTAPPASSSTSPPAPWRQPYAEAIAPLARVRAAVSTGRLAGMTEAAASLAEVSLDPSEITPAPVPVGVPREIAAPVGRLLATIEAAAEVARAALRADRATLHGLSRALERLSARVDEPAAQPRIHRLIAEAGSAVDPAASLRGAALITAVLDHVLPELRGHAGALSASSDRVTGCDVVDLPDVCIGGTGSNTYEEDRTLLIDLGGDDLHANSAGGAGTGILNPGNGLVVSVAVDLGGDDRYQTSTPMESQAQAVQGAGVDGGIGILVDAAGSDTYAVAASRTRAVASGQGFGAVGGTGILADLGGNDAYVVSGTVPGGRANGVGFGGFAGTGLMLDVAGNDSYLVESRPQAPLVLEGEEGEEESLFSGAAAQGVAVAGLGVAVFADLAGNDTLAVEAVPAPIGPEETRPSRASGGVFGFGSGIIAGDGVAVFGAGTTARTARVEVQAPTIEGASIHAFGSGSAGYGALHDAAGDDTYVSEITGSAVRRAVVEDGCECLGVETVASSLGMSSRSQGHGSFAGTGVLQDASGNDRYASIVSQTVEAAARDDRTTLPPPPPPDEGEEPPVEGAVARALGSFAFSAVQGHSSILTAAGILEDLAGNDVYDSRTSVEARATASARLPESPTEAHAFTREAWSESQAATFGMFVGDLALALLRDAGGGDTYTSTNETLAVADPPTTESTGEAISHVQASAQLGAAFLIDVDDGVLVSDTFGAVPENPACLGERGRRAWRDCGFGLGLGTNP